MFPTLRTRMCTHRSPSQILSLPWHLHKTYFRKHFGPGWSVRPADCWAKLTRAETDGLGSNFKSSKRELLLYQLDALGKGAPVST